MTSTIQIPVTLRPSRTRTLVLFFLCLMFVLGGIWMVRDGQWFGYFCAGFFGLGLPVFLLQFHPKAAYLHLAPEGFTFCGLFRPHTIPWTHVRQFGVTNLSGLWTVGWNYTPAHQPTRRVHRIVQSVCGYVATFPDTYGMKPYELANLLESLRQKYTETSSSA